MKMEDFNFNTKLASVEYNNIEKKYVGILEDILDDLDIKVARKEWKSKYNSYVVYDYEPFCTDGFNINMICTSPMVQKLDFATYLYKQKIKQIESLENMLKDDTLDGVTYAGR